MRGVAVDKRFGFHQSCGNRGSVERVPVFGLRWYGRCRWVVRRGLGQGSRKVGLCHRCVSCESGFFVQMEGPGICLLC